MDEKLKYEKPELVDLENKDISGGIIAACADGSTNSGSCGNGGTAEMACGTGAEFQGELPA